MKMSKFPGTILWRKVRHYNNSLGKLEYCRAIELALRALDLAPYADAFQSFISYSRTSYIEPESVSLYTSPIYFQRVICFAEGSSNASAMPPAAVSVLYSPSALDGDVAEIETSMKAPFVLRNRLTCTKTVKWGSSLKLNFDKSASPCWIGYALSSSSFIYRFNQSSERQKRDILSAFPGLSEESGGRGDSTSTGLVIDKSDVPASARSAVSILKEPRWSTKPRPCSIMREKQAHTRCIGACQESICWFGVGSLSSPTLSLTDDDSDDSETALLDIDQSSDCEKRSSSNPARIATG